MLLGRSMWLLLAVGSFFVIAPSSAPAATWEATVTLGNGVSFTGAGKGAAVPPTPMILSSNAGLPGADANSLARCFLNTLDPAKIAGKIVVCDRGINALTDKSDAVMRAGGVGMVLVNLGPGDLRADDHAVPTVHVGLTEGQVIKTYAAGTATPTASFSAGVFVTDCPSAFDLDFSGSQYAECFREVHRGGDITAGRDLGPTDFDSLNFEGLTGAGGATWLTVYDATPDTPAPGSTFEGFQKYCADILFSRFNNLKGAGIVALLNEGANQAGLALIVSDAGNTDLLRLAVIEGDATKKGKFTVLQGCGGVGKPCSVPLKSGIAENVWYRLIMTVEPSAPRVMGEVWTHLDPLDPNSELAALVGPALIYTPTALPAGVSVEGQVGLMAQAVSAVVDLSITNFRNERTLCQTPPVK